MRRGLMRHRVDIERPVATQDANGDPVVTWAPVVKNVPARIESVTAREFIAGLLLASQVTAKITIDWREDVDATMRIKRRMHRSTPREFELYNIAGILPDETGRRYLTMPVTMGVNEG